MQSIVQTVVVQGMIAIYCVAPFLDLCGGGGCAQPQSRVEAADPWPPSSECYVVVGNNISVTLGS